MKNFTIELSGNWVLGHRGDDVLPIAFLREALSRISDIKIADISLTEITVSANGDMMLSDIRKYVCDAFEKRYPGELENSRLKVTESGSEAGPEQPETGPAGADGNISISDILTGGAAVLHETGEMPSAEKKDAAAETLASVRALIGADEFKALAEEVARVAPEVRSCGTGKLFAGMSYLFSIGDGCGLTTYLGLYHKLVCDLGLVRGADTRKVTELSLGAVKESEEPFAEAMQMLGSGDEDFVRLLCVDISEWMSHTDDRWFRQFLRSIEKHAGEFIIVFRVPFVDKDVLARLSSSIGDVLSVRTLSFPPMTEKELIGCAERELKEYGFKAAKNAWQPFVERMADEKSDGRFYGLNTVKKVVRELIYAKQLSNAGKKKRSLTVTFEDMRSLVSDDAGELTGEQMLEKLVGSENIKKKIGEIVAQIELADKSDERPCIHMRFVGNPGTGKTTVARIIGRMLKERGILSAGNFYEYSGRDLCGRYVGETAPKTAGICRDAYGSVLFIDEAYSLYRGGGDWDYGKEAIDTLIAEMENHRGDFVVIMAGYTEDMDKLMESNAGLKSRMPYTIEFPNFDGEQLYLIFKSMLGKRFGANADMLDAARRYFENIPADVLNSKEFGNARFVRNLFERTWAKAAMRSQLAGRSDITLTKDDFEQACADKDFAFGTPRMRRIGF